MDPREKFLSLHNHPRQGRTLIVGSKLYEGREDRRALYPNAVGVDLQPGDGVDVVQDMEGDCRALGRFTHIECCSVLEHCRRPWLVAENLQRLLVPCGTLLVSVPFVWRFHGYPEDYFRFTASGVQTLFPCITWSSLQYVSDKLRVDHYLRATEDADGHPFLPRTEVIGFGVRTA